MSVVFALFATAALRTDGGLGYSSRLVGRLAVVATTTQPTPHRSCGDLPAIGRDVARMHRLAVVRQHGDRAPIRSAPHAALHSNAYAPTCRHVNCGACIRHNVD
jgi:hypothetical protein